MCTAKGTSKTICNFDNHVISLIELSWNRNPKWPVILLFQISSLWSGRKIVLHFQSETFVVKFPRSSVEGAKAREIGLRQSTRPLHFFFSPLERTGELRSLIPLLENKKSDNYNDETVRWDCESWKSEALCAETKNHQSHINSRIAISRASRKNEDLKRNRLLDCYKGREPFLLGIKRFINIWTAIIHYI